MMYNEKFVLAVKANGKILREHGDQVFVPFGSEYSLLFKNLNNVRVQATMTIDGQQMLEGGLVIDPGQTIDLERSIKGGSLNLGHRFKFIERTAKIENGPRGIGLEDGIIRVEFEFERPQPVYRHPQPFMSSPLRGTLPAPYNSTEIYGSIGGATSDWYDGGHVGSATMDSYHPKGEYATKSAVPRVLASSAGGTRSASANQIQAQNAGITVQGSLSQQAFVNVADVKGDGVKHVLVLRLVGDVDGQLVTKAVTTKFKPTCVTCGTVAKSSTQKFCHECGTSVHHLTNITG